MKNWIIAFAVLLAVCIAAFLLLKNFTMPGDIAVIRVDGEVYKKIDLSTVAVAYDIEIDSELGYNKVHVSKGSISVIEADCPDHVCIKQGEIHDDGVPIICMPHHLTIDIEGDRIDG